MSIRQIPFIFLFLFIISFQTLYAQVAGQNEQSEFSISLRSVEIMDMNPIHSFAYATHEDCILIVGGRIDGLHARQPFNAFPLAFNNKELIVANPISKEVWTSTLELLPASLQEQLQSTNMNFHQVADTLYIMGGYAFSESYNDHITFPYLTTIIVSELVESIKSGTMNPTNIKQTSDARFANTGGQMGWLDEKLIVVGGNTFMGRYNPMGNPTYTQVYLPHIQYFKINNSGEQPEITLYDKVTNEAHLRRRDYNLVPYIFTDGEPGYLLSAGVFRPDALLPFLYPVEISASGYTPKEDVEQLLSHYHSPKLSLLDEYGDLHMIFFGGLAQFYYENEVIVQDNNVPFVSTISRFTRTQNGEFSEHVLPNTMPGLKGTNAEFIPNKNLPTNQTGVFFIDEFQDSNEHLLGYIIGGINTPERNPFTNNNTQFTSASSSVYEVVFGKATNTSIPIEKPQEIRLNQNYPNPFNPTTQLSFYLHESSFVTVDIFNLIGSHIQTIVQDNLSQGLHSFTFDGSNLATGMYIYRLRTPETIRSKKMILVK